MENTEENSEKIGKIWKKIVKCIFFISFHYSTYFSSVFSKSYHYSTYLSSIFFIPFPYLTYFSVITFGEYRRKLWKDMKNMEEK
jgi:hypothetical protein